MMLFINDDRSEISSTKDQDPNVPAPRKDLEAEFLEYEAKVVFLLLSMFHS